MSRAVWLSCGVRLARTPLLSTPFSFTLILASEVYGEKHMALDRDDHCPYTQSRGRLLTAVSIRRKRPSGRGERRSA